MKPGTSDGALQEFQIERSHERLLFGVGSSAVSSLDIPIVVKVLSRILAGLVSCKRKRPTKARAWYGCTRSSRVDVVIMSKGGISVLVGERAGLPGTAGSWRA